jgi:hypothetical protein
MDNCNSIDGYEGVSIIDSLKVVLKDSLTNLSNDLLTMQRHGLSTDELEAFVFAVTNGIPKRKKRFENDYDCLLHQGPNAVAINNDP